MGRGLWWGLEMLGRSMLRAWCWVRCSGDVVFGLELGWHEDRVCWVSG